jgi:two-component system, cell cycle response regulator
MGRDRVVGYASLADAADRSPQNASLYSDVFEGKTARDVMTPLAVSLHENDTVEEAIRFFSQAGISSAPVLAADGALVGFISERDLMAAMTLSGAWNRPLSSIMRSNVICYEEDTQVRVIYEFLCRVAIRGVVITRADRPVGMISRGSLLQWFREWSLGKKLFSATDPSPWRACSTAGTASEPVLRSPDT